MKTRLFSTALFVLIIILFIGCDNYFNNMSGMYYRPNSDNTSDVFVIAKLKENNYLIRHYSSIDKNSKATESSHDYEGYSSYSDGKLRFEKSSLGGLLKSEVILNLTDNGLMYDGNFYTKYRDN